MYKFLQDIPPPGSYEVSNYHSKSQGEHVLEHYQLLCFTIGRAQINRSGSLKCGFLSSSSRSVPPRDVMLDEPDITNPGIIAL